MNLLPRPRFLELTDRLVAAQPVRTRIDGPALNRALADTGRLQLVFCVGLAAGVLLS